MSVLVFGDSHVQSLQAHLEGAGAPRLIHCESYPGWSAERMVNESSWTLDVALSEDDYETCVLVAGSNDGSDAEGKEWLTQLRQRVVNGLRIHPFNCWVVCPFAMPEPWLSLPELVPGQEHMTDSQAREFAEEILEQISPAEFVDGADQGERTKEDGRVAQ